jgi:O-antigen biosynthesis protein
VRKVSIIIVSYNVRSYVSHAIDSILKSDYNNFEIIVVDNNSYDGTCDHLKTKYKTIHVISNDTNAGFGKAVNQGAKHADGEYLFVLNPDTIIEEDTISKLIKFISMNKNIGMVGPKILNADGSLQLSCKRSFPTLKVALPKILGLDKIFPNSKWMGKYNLTFLDPSKSHTVDAISGSCMMISASVFKKIGGFDENFFMFGEDIDICLRIWKANFEIHYFSGTKIVHYKGESVKTAPYDSRQAFYDSMDIFVDKHYSSTLSLVTRVFISFGIRLNKSLASFNEKKSLFLSLLMDLIIISGSFSLAVYFRFNNFDPIFDSHGLVPIIYVALWLLVYSYLQLYSRYILSYSRALIGTVIGFLLAVFFTYFFKQFAYSRLVIINASILIALFLPGWRIFAHYLISRGYFRSVKHSKSLLFARKAIVLGSDIEGVRIAESIINRFDSGLDLIGYIDKNYPKEINSLPIPFLGKLNEARQLINTHRINEIIFSSTSFSNKEILDFMDETRDLRLIYRMVPSEQDILLGKSNVEDIGGISFINIENNFYQKFHKFSKRIFDIIISILFLIISSPIILSYITFGRLVKIQFWGEAGIIINARIFKTNNKLIRDIPLLFDVLKGNISIVGSTLVNSGETLPGILCKPGITGLERLKNIKLKSETRKSAQQYYIQNQNLKLDVEIIIKTLLNG